MKIGELIKILSKYNPDREILVCGPIDPDFYYYPTVTVFEDRGKLKLFGKEPQE